MAEITSNEFQNKDNLDSQAQAGTSTADNAALQDQELESQTKTEDADILNVYREDEIYDSRTNNHVNRDYQSNESNAYWLPKDEDEQHRLTGQHFAIKDVLGGNFLPKVKEIIDFEKGVSILDIGCGSGIWIMDMAGSYPKCEYEGCDIVDIVYKNVGVKKINYSYGNVVEGLKYPDNSFDFVYMRLLVLALREEEWPKAIKELIRVTKPGGVFHLTEFDIKITGGAATQKMLEGVHAVCKKRGQNPRIALQLEDIINEIGGSKIIQSEYRSVCFADDTPVSKKLRWDWEEGTAGIIPVIGPMIGIVTEEEQKKFLEDLHEDLLTSEGYSFTKAIAVQKL